MFVRAVRKAIMQQGVGMQGLKTVAAAAALVLAGLGSATAQDKKPVNIYIWNDYLGETTIDDFKKATGYGANVDLYDSLELLEQKVLVGKSGYDVIVPTAEPALSRLIQAKVLQPLDKAKIPNLQNVSPDVLKQLEKSDPGNKYAVPYLGGTIGIGVIPAKIKAVAPDAPLDSWDLVFKPEIAKKVAACGITILDSASDVVPTVFNYLGLDPNSKKKEDHDAVEKLLLSIRPYVKQFVTGQNINLLAAGDACVVVGYNGDVIQAKARAAEAKNGVVVDYIIPKEGAQAWWDTLAIPADAPNKDAAYAFLNFALDVKNMAGISNGVKYANALPAALPLVKEEIRTDSAIFPTAEQQKKLFAISAVNPQVDRMRTRLWTKVKTGK